MPPRKDAVEFLCGLAENRWIGLVGWVCSIAFIAQLITTVLVAVGSPAGHAIASSLIALPSWIGMVVATVAILFLLLQAWYRIDGRKRRAIELVFDKDHPDFRVETATNGTGAGSTVLYRVALRNRRSEPMRGVTVRVESCTPPPEGFKRNRALEASATPRQDGAIDLPAQSGPHFVQVLSQARAEGGPAPEADLHYRDGKEPFGANECVLVLRVDYDGPPVRLPLRVSFWGHDQVLTVRPEPGAVLEAR